MMDHIACHPNPLYICYAKAHGRTWEKMLDYDKEAWPGAVMCGFILWMEKQWKAWAKMKGYRRDHPMSSKDRAGFYKWLRKKVKL